MATKRSTTKKTVKNAPAKRVSSRKTSTKRTCNNKKVAEAYYWGGIAIALCAAGAFTVLAFGIGSVIR